MAINIAFQPTVIEGFIGADIGLAGQVGAGLGFRKRGLIVMVGFSAIAVETEESHFEVDVAVGFMAENVGQNEFLEHHQGVDSDEHGSDR